MYNIFLFLIVSFWCLDFSKESVSSQWTIAWYKH